MRLLRCLHEETRLGPEDHELLKAGQDGHGFRQLTTSEADALNTLHLEKA